ncbi:hypothetical protein APA_514 [Pseudanabaena sp. lw0831]|uniref:hypothetical protein n=1 Tax=Pseudanabaena sp. lw0831 TaxID=1357935 RepID=UPI001914FA50|nr:hypothetical protein [Pseudanabaena sp. lw0831]GBO51550.1 hypothetical protein APA_514 [Pseudanabaena sp. lw0831]
MKKKNSPSSVNILKTDVSGLLWRWLKGIWSGFNRWIKRSLNPSTGKRPSTVVDIRTRASQQKRVVLHVSPLVGVRNSHNVESLTVEKLFATVKWQSTTQTSNSSTISYVKDKISWD